MAKAGKGTLIGRLQAAARHSRTELASRLSRHGLYPGQDQVMLALRDGDGPTPGGLAAQLGVRPPTITKTINRLQSQGFLDRRPSETDSRQAHIFLTALGEEAVKTIEKSLRKTEKIAFRGIDRKEQKALAKLLARIEANLAAGGDAVAELEDEDDAE